MKQQKKSLIFWLMFAVALIPVLAKALPTLMLWINECKGIYSSMTATNIQPEKVETVSNEQSE